MSSVTKSMLAAAELRLKKEAAARQTAVDAARNLILDCFMKAAANPLLQKRSVGPAEMRLPHGPSMGGQIGMGVGSMLGRGMNFLRGGGAAPPSAGVAKPAPAPGVQPGVAKPGFQPGTAKGLGPNAQEDTGGGDRGAPAPQQQLAPGHWATGVGTLDMLGGGRTPPLPDLSTEAGYQEFLRRGRESQRRSIEPSDAYKRMYPAPDPKLRPENWELPGPMGAIQRHFRSQPSAYDRMYPTPKPLPNWDPGMTPFEPRAQGGILNSSALQQLQAMMGKTSAAIAVGYYYGQKAAMTMAPVGTATTKIPMRNAGKTMGLANMRGPLGGGPQAGGGPSYGNAALSNLPSGPAGGDSSK